MKRFLIFCLIIGTQINSLNAAEQQYIDSIVAIVDEDIITNFELNAEVKRISENLVRRGKSIPETDILNRQVLELMINRSLLMQQAKKRGVKTTDSRLNRTILSMAQKNNLDLSQFRQAIIDEGMEYSKFRQSIRDDLTMSTIKSRYANQQVEITDAEVDEFIKRNGGVDADLEYLLYHILIALPDAALSKQVQDARLKAENILQKLSEGIPFSQLASEFSTGSNALQGGDLGWRKIAEIPSLFAKITPKLEKGEYAGPIRSANGFHIISLVDRRNAEQVLIPQTHARHILIKSDTIITESEAEQQLNELRERIVQGEDFALLAKTHSVDHNSGALGGELGWVGKGETVPLFEEVMEGLKIGELSHTFKSQFGWHIIEVLGRRTVDETKESKRSKISQQLLKQKKTEVLELWQRQLRDEAYVKFPKEVVGNG